MKPTFHVGALSLSALDSFDTIHTQLCDPEEDAPVNRRRCPRSDIEHEK